MSVIDSDKPAVVLLSRPGPAREKLRTAIQNAGGDLVLECAPLEADAGGVLGLSPAAVVLALDEGDDDVLDELLPRFTDVGVTLLLEEADLAAAREGWDAQRWERHLSAKLQGHQNVLPPGATELSADEEGAFGLTAVSGPSRDEASPAVPMPRDPGNADLLSPDSADGLLSVPAGNVTDSIEATDWSSLGFGDDSLDWEPPATVASEPVQGLDFIPSLEQDAPAVESDDARGNALEIALAHAESALALSGERDHASDERSVPPPFPARVDAPPPSQWSLMSLDDAPPVAPAQPAPPPVQAWNLEGLSLAPIDGEEPALSSVMGKPVQAIAAPAPKGVALLMGGIGGPDAVRRLLAFLPAAGMGGALLIHIKLDGGRYENLATQLARSSPAPLSLAMEGETLAAGHVYVVDERTGLAKTPSGWQFVPQLPGQTLLQGLSKVTTGAGVVMLSGADPDQVPAVLDLHAREVWVAGQSGEGCYDPAAASALAVAGLPVGEPAWLAAGLLALWQ